MVKAARIGLLIAAAGTPAFAEGSSPYVLHGLRSARTPDWFLGMFFGIVGLICFYELVVFAGYRRRENGPSGSKPA